MLIKVDPYNPWKTPVLRTIDEFQDLDAAEMAFVILYCDFSTRRIHNAESKGEWNYRQFIAAKISSPPLEAKWRNSRGWTKQADKILKGNDSRIEKAIHFFQSWQGADEMEAILTAKERIVRILKATVVTEEDQQWVATVRMMLKDKIFAILDEALENTGKTPFPEKEEEEKEKKPRRIKKSRKTPDD